MGVFFPSASSSPARSKGWRCTPGRSWSCDGRGAWVRRLEVEDEGVQVEKGDLGLELNVWVRVRYLGDWRLGLEDWTDWSQRTCDEKLFQAKFV